MDNISKKVKKTLHSDLTKAGACGALLITAPHVPVLAGLLALTSAIGLGYFSGKHVQKKTLLKTLNAHTSAKKKIPSGKSRS